METRALTRIGLLQTGIVLGGYLLATACIKLGYDAATKGGFAGTTWSVDFIREHGLLPLVLPLVWICGALAFQKKARRECFFNTLPLLSGGALVLVLFFGYALAAVDGLQGPPRPGIIMQLTP